jgi:phosphoribosylformylglycinamidine synthase
MLKPEIHDPQGEAIAGACHRLGFAEVVSVRQGKRFEVELADQELDAIDAADPGEQHGTADSQAATPPGQRAMAHRVAELAAELLANPIIEEFAIHGV